MKPLLLRRARLVLGLPADLPTGTGRLADDAVVMGWDGDDARSVELYRTPLPGTDRRLPAATRRR